MNNSNIEHIPVVFLDTNALHNAGSYLLVAKRRNLPPYGASREFSAVRQRLRRTIPKGIVEGLMKGARTIAYLQGMTSPSGDEAFIRTSRLARAEMLYGILDGKAHARMARAGIPYRMRQRLSVLSELVRSRLTQEDYCRAYDDIGFSFSQIEQLLNASMLYVEDQYDISQIVTLLEFMLSHVFIDVLDAWMYSCALVIQANYVITFDRYFNDLIHRMHNPGGAPKSERRDWRKLQRDLTNALRDTIGLTQPVLPQVPDTMPSDVPYFR